MTQAASSASDEHKHIDTNTMHQLVCDFAVNQMLIIYTLIYMCIIYTQSLRFLSSFFHHDNIKSMAQTCLP